MEKKLNEMTITEAHDGLVKGDFTCLQLVDACLAQIDKYNGGPDGINAFITVLHESARAEAQLVDNKIKTGEELGLLEGIPYGAKDIILTEDVKTTASSNMLKDFIAPYDATVIARLREAGAILIGKENCDSFGHGASTENSDFGVVRNPWDKTRVAGGSSGGSAASVASGMTIFSLGGDTGGSIRQPSAFCNLVGLRPSYGRVSRYGGIAFSSSTDTIGPITKTVEDNAIVLEALAGLDSRDHTTRPDPVPSYKDKLQDDERKLVLGVPKEFLSKDIELGTKDAINKALEILVSQGHKIKEISLPLATEHAIAIYYLLTTSEISSNLARLDGVRYGSAIKNPNTLEELYKNTRTKGFGIETRRRIMLGTYSLSSGYYDAYYKQAQKVRTLIRNDFDKAFKDVDYIISPTSPFPAFKIGEKTADPLALYLADINLDGFSMAGLPSISVPADFSDNLPVGLQITGKYMDEVGVYQLAHQFQSQTEHHEQKPKLVDSE